MISQLLHDRTPSEAAHSQIFHGKISHRTSAIKLFSPCETLTVPYSKGSMYGQLHAVIRD